jgi:hypothetical protein
MIKNLKFLTDEAMVAIKYGDRKSFCKKMIENPNDIEWISPFLNLNKNPFANSDYSFDFTFEPYHPKSTEEDINNAIKLYELFKKNDIGPAIIYNEKFLTGFIFSFGYPYFMKVIGAEKESHVFATLFFENDIHRSVARNVIGKLYRYIQMTVDESSQDDRYWLTKFVLKYKSLLRLKYYTFTDGKNTHKSYFKAFWEWSKETNQAPTSKLVENVRLRLSLLSNVSETDLMDEKELISILKAYIFDCNKKD